MHCHFVKVLNHVDVVGHRFHHWLYEGMDRCYEAAAEV
ncbi:hypothetical protein F8B43_5726 [Methylorubrum populi]|uniref:Uncharacterized protein n=1 Tax=Methylorubrum populi TaxID=223967 RepID=A0A833J1D0_9HYPH|nr:hypothetical protein F8B43_5726 [Methylorubrum populi]